jgi:hypothetical protein
MERVTQGNANNAEQSATASEELATQAQGLYNIVERVRRLAGGGNAISISPARAATPGPLRAIPVERRIPSPAPAMAHLSPREFPLDDRDIS